MPRLSSTWIAVGLSTVVHVALAAVAAGHGPESRTSPRAAPAELTIDLAPLPEPEDPAQDVDDHREPPVAARAHAGTPAPHHHDYPVPLDHDAHPHDPALVHTPLALPAPPEEPSTAAPVVAADDAPLHFVITLPPHAPHGAGSHEAHAPDGQNGLGAADPGEIVGERDVSVPARLLARGALTYPSEARLAQIEADVPVELVVSETGAVLRVRALAASGYGLDEAAVRAVRNYRFSPAIRGGRAVRVRMRWVVQFKLD